MRIIAGAFRGRRFTPPADKWPTRPTTDIAKEGLFNILQNEVDFGEMRMLDLFGGTGNHCYECISRGCPDATYVDKHPPAVRFVQRLSRELGIEDRLRVVRSDVFRFVDAAARREVDGADAAYTYCFAGPPYPLPTLDTIPDKFLGSGLLAGDGLFVLEHNPNHDFSEHPRFERLRTYGKTYFSFFR